MKLPKATKFAFGFGAFGKDLVYMLVANYVLYYYNAVLGVSSVFIGAILMGARVFDAINDPIMGIVVAKTNTRFGRFRPWVLTGTVLNAVTIYALFAAPDAGEGRLRLWLAVVYILWGITYTMMDIPFWSMIPAITEPGSERESLSSFSRSCAGIGDAIPMVATMIVVPILAGSSVIADYKIGFRWWGLIIAVVFVLSEIVFCKIVDEKKPEEMETVGIGQMFRSLFRNDQAMTAVAAVILVYLALNIVGNLVLYFFQFDVGNTDAYSVFVAGCFAAQVLAMFMIPAMRKRIDKMQLFRYAILIQIAGFIVLLLVAYSGLYKTMGWGILMIPGVLVYTGYGVLTVMLTIFLADSVDYGELKNGSREESVIFSMQTFTVKLAAGIGVFIAGIVIDMVGLDPQAASQSISALNGLRVYMTIPSALILVIAYIIFRKYYVLDDAKMDDILASLKSKVGGGK